MAMNRTMILQRLEGIGILKIYMEETEEFFTGWKWKELILKDVLFFWSISYQMDLESTEAHWLWILYNTVSSLWL